MVKKVLRKSNNQFINGTRICKHCNGHLRYYHGTLTCLMCGRDVDHVCQECMDNEDLLVKTA
ncbi:MAG: hypothetical protein IEMM0002_1548 [bacterium]|nr:MAG: hypothetical protein IEMM0002_1548 [bacterium]